MTICNVCNKNEVPPWRKIQCDDCAKAKEVEWNAKRYQPIAQPVPVNPEVIKIADPNKIADVEPENGKFQSTVWNHSVAANSYEIGKVGDRFKLYFETPAELLAKIAELRAAGLMTVQDLAEEFKPEHIPHE